MSEPYTVKMWPAEPFTAPDGTLRYRIGTPPDGTPPASPQAALVAAPAPSLRTMATVRTEWVNTCLYRECRTGCERSLCWAGRGDSNGQVLRADCLACLAGAREPRPSLGG